MEAHHQKAANHGRSRSLTPAKQHSASPVAMLLPMSISVPVRLSPTAKPADNLGGRSTAGTYGAVQLQFEEKPDGGWRLDESGSGPRWLSRQWISGSRCGLVSHELFKCCFTRSSRQICSMSRMCHDCNVLFF